MAYMTITNFRALVLRSFGDITSVSKSRTIYSRSRYAIPKTRERRTFEDKTKSKNKDRLSSEDQSLGSGSILLFDGNGPRRPQRNQRQEERQLSRQYAGRIARYLQYGNVKTAFSVFTEMRDTQTLITRDLYNIMIIGLTRSGDPNGAIDVFNEMCRNNIHPNGKTLSSVFLAFSNCGPAEGRCERLKSILEEFKRSQETRDAQTLLYVHNAAMKALIFCGDPLSSFEIYDDMLSCDVKPDEVTLSTLFLACQQDKVGGMDKAIKILNEFKKQDVRMRNAETYNALLLICRDCYDKKKFQELLHFFAPQCEVNISDSKLQSLVQISRLIGCEKDMKSYQLLLYEARSAEEVSYVAELLHDYSSVPDRHFVKTLLKKYASFGNPEMCVKLIHKYVDNEDRELADKLISELFKEILNPYHKVQLMKILREHGFQLSSEQVCDLLCGIRCNRRLYVIQDIIEASEEEKLVPLKETIDFVQKYINMLLKKQLLGSHFLYLNRWIEKWDKEKEVLHSNAEDPKYDHL